jgi:uncharacterized DUF497 family protein
MTFQWDIEKNWTLKAERNIQFEDIVVAIENGQADKETNPSK